MFPVKIDRPSCSLPNAGNWMVWFPYPNPSTHRQTPTFSVRTNPLQSFKMDGKIEGSQDVLLKDSEMHASLIAQECTVGFEIKPSALAPPAGFERELSLKLKTTWTFSAEGRLATQAANPSPGCVSSMTNTPYSPWASFPRAETPK